MDRKGSRREELKIKGKQYHYVRSKIIFEIKNPQKKRQGMCNQEIADNSDANKYCVF